MVFPGTFENSMLTCLAMLAVVNYAVSSLGFGGRDNAAFEALLGTPNLNGIAWLLIQHYVDLGRKTIKSVTVWNSQGEIDVLVSLVPARSA